MLRCTLLIPPLSPPGLTHLKGLTMSEYDVCNWIETIPNTPSTIDVYREIAPKLKYTVVYNGNTDPCVSYEGTRTAIERVDFKDVKGGGMRPWFYNHTAACIEVIAEKAPLFGPDLLPVPTKAQFGGGIVNYEHNLSFLIVHGSGHMVPQFRAQAALHMLEKVLNRDLFAPFMPSNCTLAKITDDAFEDAINGWTEMAMGPPYVRGSHNWEKVDEKIQAALEDDEVAQAK